MSKLFSNNELESRVFCFEIGTYSKAFMPLSLSFLSKKCDFGFLMCPRVKNLFFKNFRVKKMKNVPYSHVQAVPGAGRSRTSQFRAG